MVGYETLSCLSKYRWKERECNDILKKDALKICIQLRIKIVSLNLSGLRGIYNP